MRKALLIMIAAAALAGSCGVLAAQQQPGARPTNMNANITAEQKERIRGAVLKESNAPRVQRVDFSITIGNVVPGSIPIAPVPKPIVDAFPQWQGYGYFVIQDQIQDQIIIVDPRSHTIVAILA